MESAGSNPYKAPESDVLNRNLECKVSNFKRFSAWGVFGLGFITLGIYYVYWIYTRTQVINEFHTRKIATGPAIGLVIVVIISFLFGIYSGATEQTNALFEGVINIAYFVLYLVAVFAIRGCLIEIADRKISGVLTFFFSAIYLQYKINEAIDESA